MTSGAMREDGGMILVDFLLSRIAEDERKATETRPHEHLRTRNDLDLGRVDEGGYETCTITSGRVLAEAEAKRRIVGACGQVSTRTHSALTLDEMFAADACRYSLRQLAVIYAAHPDYREEWRP